MDTKQLIEKLGGTSEVARLCEINPASVSEWKAKNEIPHARLMFLRLARPEAFSQKANAPACANR